MSVRWSEAEKKFLRDNAAYLKDHEIAAALARLSGRCVGVDAVQRQRVLLGIDKARGPGETRVVRRRKDYPAQ